LAVFWLQTALSAEKSGAARADSAYSTRPSGADCGVFSLTGLDLSHEPPPAAATHARHA
jgi:hypothetical protein